MCLRLVQSLGLFALKATKSPAKAQEGILSFVANKCCLSIFYWILERNCLINDQHRNFALPMACRWSWVESYPGNVCACQKLKFIFK
jgi:hypothetical protein